MPTANNKEALAMDIYSSVECLPCRGILFEIQKGTRTGRRKRFLSLICTVALFVVLRTYSGIQLNNDEILVYEFTADEPSHLHPVNIGMDCKKSDKIVSIDVIHRQGLLHRGNWIYVVDSLNRILVLKRGSKLVTCANSWSLVGEHAFGNETPLETTQRGIREELGNDVLPFALLIRQLGEHPLYYFREYGPSNKNRVDRQLTFNWWVLLSVPGDAVQLNLDHEVIDHKWLTIAELEEWVNEDWQRNKKVVPLKRLCHVTILQLFQISVAELKKGMGEVALTESKQIL